MAGLRLCATCQKRFKAILKAYNVGPSAMRDKRSLARGWALIIKDALNGLCWCSGGDCTGSTVPPTVFPEALLKQWREDEGALSARALLAKKKKSSRAR